MMYYYAWHDRYPGLSVLLASTVVACVALVAAGILGLLTGGLVLTTTVPYISQPPFRYEQVSGVVRAITVSSTSNSWNGTNGNCRVSIVTATGQKTISPYWRDCYQISEGDSVSVYRRINDRGGPHFLDGSWKWMKD